MTYRLFHCGPASALFGSSPIVKREQAEMFADAAALLERARAIHAQTDAARAQAVEDGRAEGRRQALAQCEDFIAQRLAPFLEEASRAQDELREDLAELALRAVRRMLAELPEDLALAGAASRAVATLDIDQVGRVAVSPGLLAAVKARVDAGLAGLLVADEALAPGDCVIHARSGRIIASLDLQIARLAERWGLGGAPE